MNGKLHAALLTLILAMLGWLAVEIRELRREMAIFDARLDRVVQNVAVLLERTKALAPGVSQGSKQVETRLRDVRILECLGH